MLSEIQREKEKLAGEKLQRRRETRKERKGKVALGDGLNEDETMGCGSQDDDTESVGVELRRA